MLWTVPLTLLLSQLVFAQSDIQSVQNAFTQAHVVPDVLPSFNPLATIDVVFTDSSMQQLNVTPGINLTMAQTAMQPQFFLNTNNATIENGTFVLAIVDPDAPTPQNTSISQFRHMLGGDFHVDTTSGSTLLVNNSAALSDFVPPTPPAGSDPHRYVILLFNQSTTFSSDTPALVNASTPRTNFNITTFAAALQLGSPIAGNFFFTGPDNTTSSSASSVPLSTVFSTTVVPPSTAIGGASPTTTAPAGTGAAGGTATNGVMSRGHGDSKSLALSLSVTAIFLITWI